MPKKKITTADEVAAHRKRKDYIGDYQRRMYKLGKRGRLGVLFSKMRERLLRYVEESEDWKLNKEEESTIQQICELLDDLTLQLGGESK